MPPPSSSIFPRLLHSRTIQRLEIFWQLQVETNSKKGSFTLFLHGFCLVPQLHQSVQYKLDALHRHLFALWQVFLQEHDTESVSYEPMPKYVLFIYFMLRTCCFNIGATTIVIIVITCHLAGHVAQNHFTLRSTA